MMASFAALHEHDEDDDDSDSTDEEEEEEAPTTLHQEEVADDDAATADRGGGEEPEPAEEEEEEEDGDSDSGDGDLPLATPYPWAQDDYELTLHHEPKRRKQVGSGMLYIKRLLQDDDSPYEEATVLSAPAKAILKQILTQHTKKPKPVDAEDDDSSDESDDEEEESDDDDDDEETKRLRRRLPGPRLWTSGLESQGTGLFYNILEVMEQEHPLNVTTRHILRTCALKLPAGAPPGSMDAKEFVCCALHFLSSDWESPDPSQLPSLPLIRSTTAPGNARDLEKRSYEKASDWTLDDLPLGELERLFLDSPSSAAQLQWISRVRFCPRSADGAGMAESTILLKGTIPARMTKSSKTTAPKKRKSAAPAPAPAATQGVVIRADQGKQFPFHPFASHSGEE